MIMDLIKLNEMNTRIIDIKERNKLLLLILYIPKKSWIMNLEACLSMHPDNESAHELETKTHSQPQI